MKYRRTTITDIAKAAETSPSTVSRALNDDPRISQNTKDKVMTLAREMEYTPTLLSHGLAKKKTSLIGLLMYTLDPFYGALYRSIQETAEQLGYWVIQAFTDDDDERTHFLVKSMLKFGVDGIIFASCKMDDPVVESLIDDHFPVVLANRRIKRDKADYVVVDNAYGAYLITNHLINLGYQRIGLIGGPPNLHNSVDRYHGFIKALEDKGLEIDNKIIKQGPFFTRDIGHKLTKRLLQQSNPPEAIFCCDENLALGCIKALQDAELRVPHDVAVAGFDDAEVFITSYIRLTTVSHSAEEMGRLAAKIMVDKIEKEPDSIQRIVLEPKLVIRESCGFKLHSPRFHATKSASSIHRK